jgi:hyperosmotically inducible periplasmic protein
MKKGSAYRTTLAMVFAFAAAALVFPSPSSAAAGPRDVNEAVHAKLDKSQYKDVKAGVDKNGIATLGGTVNLYEFKTDAERIVHKVKGVTAVRNQIEVAGPAVPDDELRKQLSRRLAYDRVGYGNEFDAMTIGVQNGAVILGGHVHDYMNRNSALALVSTTPGVKDLIDEVEVDPVSQMDGDIRAALVRAIYGFSTLNKYALDPAHPIRISVQNGNVSLYGMVDSQSDKDTANIRANGVPGVFSVKNYLEVSGQPSEK